MDNDFCCKGIDWSDGRTAIGTTIIQPAINSDLQQTNLYIYKN